LATQVPKPFRPCLRMPVGPDRASAAASIIVVLIWVYYSSQIILMGAEITYAFAKYQGSIKSREQATGPSQ
jgi:uncharacterized BrkB/YihY/UPF0761 family membrane protein